MDKTTDFQALSMGNSPISQGCTFSVVQAPSTHALKYISSIVASLRCNDAPLTQEHLWEAVVADHSPEWVDITKDLRAAEERLRKLESDENKPLGHVGLALEAPAI